MAEICPECGNPMTPAGDVINPDDGTVTTYYQCNNRHLATLADCPDATLNPDDLFDLMYELTQLQIAGYLKFANDGAAPMRAALTPQAKEFLDALRNDDDLATIF